MAEYCPKCSSSRTSSSCCGSEHGYETWSCHECGHVFEVSSGYLARKQEREWEEEREEARRKNSFFGRLFG